jgi:hypothetical protein
MQIVDRQQERSAGGEVRGQPVEAVKGCKGRVGSTRRGQLLRIEKRLGKRRRARERLGPLVAR